MIIQITQEHIDRAFWGRGKGLSPSHPASLAVTEVFGHQATCTKSAYGQRVITVDGRSFGLSVQDSLYVENLTEPGQIERLFAPKEAA